MIVLNGRDSKLKDDIAMLSTIGKLIADYVKIQAVHFTKYNSFEVNPVIDILERFHVLPDSPLPDQCQSICHSIYSSNRI